MKGTHTEKQFHTVVIDDELELGLLRTDWSALWALCEDHSIFERFEWIDAAWQWMKNYADLRVVTVYRKDQLVGVVPLMLRKHQHRGVKLKRMEFLAVPDNQSCGGLFDPEWQKAVAEQVVKTLLERQREWDIIYLDLLPQGSRTIEIMRSALADAGLFFQAKAISTNPVLSLEGTWNEYYESRSRRLKKGNNLIANKLKKAYSDVRIEWVRGGDIDQERLASAVRELITISGNSWKSTTGKTLNKHGPKEFIKRLTAYAHELDWLSVWLLYLDNTPVASEYQLVSNGLLHALRADIDQAYEDNSPGTYLNWKLLEGLFGQGLKVYMMGPGDNAYKRRWAERYETLWCLVGYGRTLRGRAVSILDRWIVPLARWVRIRTLT